MPEMPTDVPRMANTVTDEQAREIENKLEVIGGGEVYEVKEEPKAEAKEEATDEVAVDATAEPETKVEDKVVESDAKEAADEESDEAGAPSKPADESPTLPSNYIRSLKATGWDDEEIQRLVEHDFDLAKNTAEKVHENRMRESREWAAHGRIVRAGEPSTPATTEPVPSQPSQTPQQLPRVDVEALKTEFGEDEAIAGIIDRMSGPVNKAIEAMNLILPQVAESAARQKESENATVATEIDTFFKSSDLAAYAELYGVGPTRGVEAEHFQNRMLVMEQADQIRVGASYQGREIGLSDALELAHDSVSSNFQMKAVRAEIKSKVQKRAKAVSLKPSITKSTPPSGDRSPITRANLEKRSASTLREIFG